MYTSWHHLEHEVQGNFGGSWSDDNCLLVMWTRFPKSPKIIEVVE